MSYCTERKTGTAATYSAPVHNDIEIYIYGCLPSTILRRHAYFTAEWDGWCRCRYKICLPKSVRGFRQFLTILMTSNCLDGVKLSKWYNKICPGTSEDIIILHISNCLYDCDVVCPDWVAVSTPTDSVEWTDFVSPLCLSDPSLCDSLLSFSLTLSPSLAHSSPLTASYLWSFFHSFANEIHWERETAS